MTKLNICTPKHWVRTFLLITQFSGTNSSLACTNQNQLWSNHPRLSRNNRCINHSSRTIKEVGIVLHSNSNQLEKNSNRGLSSSPMGHLWFITNNNSDPLFRKLTRWVIIQDSSSLSFQDLNHLNNHNREGNRKDNHKGRIRIPSKGRIKEVSNLKSNNNNFDL